MNLGNVFINFSSNISNFTNELRQVNFELSVMASLAKNGEQRFRAFAVGAFYLGQTLFNVMMESVNAFGQVDQSLANLSTVLNTTEQGFEKLKDVAIDWSNAHVTSTNDVISAMYDMASAGLEQAEVLASVDKAATLATATMGTMQQATSLLTNTMNSFGKSMSDLATPVEKASQFMETFAFTVQQFKIILPELETGMSLAAGAATALGAEVQDVSVALGAVKTAGLTASQSGTAVKNFYERLAKLNKDTGIAVRDTNGALLSVGEIIQNIKEYYGGAVDSLSEFAEIQTILGRRGSQVVALLQNQTDELLAYEKAVRSATSATEMAEKREEGFQAQMQILENRLENLRIAFGETFLPLIRQVSDIIGNLSIGLQSADDSTKGLVSSLTQIGVVGGIGIGVITPLIIIINKLRTSIIAATAATAGWATAINVLTFGIPAVLAAITGIGLAVAANSGKLEQQKKANEDLIQSNVEFSNSLVSLGETYNELTKNNTDFTESSEDLAAVIRELAAIVPGYQDLLTIDAEDIEKSIENLKNFGIALNEVIEVRKAFLEEKKAARSTELDIQLTETEKALKEIKELFARFNEFIEAGNIDLLKNTYETTDALEKAFKDIKNVQDFSFTNARSQEVREAVVGLRELNDEFEKYGVTLLADTETIELNIKATSELGDAHERETQTLIDLNKERQQLIADSQLEIPANTEIIRSTEARFKIIESLNLSLEDEKKAVDDLIKSLDEQLDSVDGNITNLKDYTDINTLLIQKQQDLNVKMQEAAKPLQEVMEDVKELKDEYTKLLEVGDFQGFEGAEFSEEKLSVLEDIVDKLREQVALRKVISPETLSEYDTLIKQRAAYEDNIKMLEDIQAFKGSIGVLTVEEQKLTLENILKNKILIDLVDERLKSEDLVTAALIKEREHYSELIKAEEERIELEKSRIKLLEISSKNTERDLNITKEIADIEGKSRLDALKDQKSLLESQISQAEKLVMADNELSDQAKERLKDLDSQRDAIDTEINQIELLNDMRDEAEKEYQAQLDENIRLRQQELDELDTLNSNLIDLLQQEGDLRERNFQQALDNYRKLSEIDVDLTVLEGEQFNLSSDLNNAKKDLLEFGKVIIAEFTKNSETIKETTKTISKSLDGIDFEKYGVSVSEYTDLIVDMSNLLANVQETSERINLDGIITPEELVELNTLNNSLVNVNNELVEYTESIKYYEEQVSRITTIEANLTAALKQAEVEFNVLGDAQNRSKTESEGYEQALKSLIKTRAQTEDAEIAKVLDEEIVKTKKLYEESLKLTKAFEELDKIYEDLEDSKNKLNKSSQSLSETVKEVNGIFTDYKNILISNNEVAFSFDERINEIEKDIKVTSSAIDELIGKQKPLEASISDLDDEYNSLRRTYEKLSNTEEKKRVQELIDKNRELADSYKNEYGKIQNTISYLTDSIDELKAAQATLRTQEFISEFRGGLSDLEETYNTVIELTDDYSKQVEILKKSLKDNNEEIDRLNILLDYAIESNNTQLMIDTDAKIVLLKKDTEKLNNEIAVLLNKLKSFKNFKTITDFMRKELKNLGIDLENISDDISDFLEPLFKLPNDNIFDDQRDAINEVRDNMVENLKFLGKELSDKKDLLAEYYEQVAKGEAESDPEFEKEMTKTLKDLTKSLTEAKNAVSEYSETWVKETEKINKAEKTAEYAENLAENIKTILNSAKETTSDIVTSVISDIDNMYASVSERETYYLDKQRQRIADRVKNEAKKYDDLLKEESDYIAAVNKGEITLNDKEVERIQYLVAEAKYGWESALQSYKEYMDYYEQRLKQIATNDYIKTVDEQLYYLGETFDYYGKKTEEFFSDQAVRNSDEDTKNEYFAEKEKQRLNDNVNYTAQMLDDTIAIREEYRKKVAKGEILFNQVVLDNIQKRVNARSEEWEKAKDAYSEYIDEITKKSDYTENMESLKNFIQVIVNSNNEIKNLGKTSVDSLSQASEVLESLNNKFMAFKKNVLSYDGSALGRFIYGSKEKAYEAALEDFFASVIEYIDEVQSGGDALDDFFSKSSESIEETIDDLESLRDELERFINETSSLDIFQIKALNEELNATGKYIEQARSALTKALVDEIVETYADEMAKLNTEFLLFGDSTVLLEGQISALEDRISDLIELKLRALKDENVLWTSELESQLIGLVDNLQELQDQYEAMEQNAQRISDVSSAITSGISSTLDEFFNLVQEFGSEEAWIQIKGKLEDNIKRNVINTIIKSLLETSLIKSQIQELTAFIVDALNDGLSQSEIGIIDKFIASIGDSVKDVAGVVDYLTNAFGLAGSSSSGIQGALNGALVTLEEVRSGKFDDYFKSFNRGDGSSSLIAQSLGISTQTLEIQSQSRSYLEQIARNTAEKSFNGTSENTQTSNYDFSGMVFNIEDANIKDPETFVQSVKPILERELAFDNRAAGL